MSKQVAGVVPEDAVEAEHDLVQVSVAESLHRLLLPVRQRGVEGDGVGAGGRAGDALLEHAEGQGAEHAVRLVGDGVGVVARVGGGHLAAALRVPNLARRCIQLDVEVLRNSRNLS